MPADPNTIRLPEDPAQLEAELLASAPAEGSSVGCIRLWAARALAAIGIVSASDMIAKAEEIAAQTQQESGGDGAGYVMAFVSGIIALLGGAIWLHTRKFKDNPVDPGERQN